MVTLFFYGIRVLCLCVGLFFSSALLGDSLKEKELLNLIREQLPKILDQQTEFQGQFYQVRPLADGGPSFINSVYQIDLLNGSALILKMENAVWKNSKTCNEVSALRFLKEHTGIPLPYVIAYNDDIYHSILKNEFILMTKSPGKPLNQEITRLYADKNKYHKVLDQLASILAELKTFCFSEIGNFLEYGKGDSSLKIGGIVDFANYTTDATCKTYSQYAENAIRFYIKEMELLVSNNSRDKAVYQKYIPILKNLLEATNFNFLNDQSIFVFSHQDFVMKNILVDGDVVTAVLDWEWCGSALPEIESLTGFDFLFTEEDRFYFSQALQKQSVSDLFAPIPKSRETFYRFIGHVYTLVAFREWQEGKLEHTAKFLNQKLQQRKIRNSIDFDFENFLIETTQELDKCILELQSFDTYLRKP